MALYKGQCTPPEEGVRIDGQVWSASGPGATIRGWSSPARSPSRWWERVDAQARLLDEIWSRMAAGDRVDWERFAVDRPDLGVCPEDVGGFGRWSAKCLGAGSSAFMVLPWGRVDVGNPHLWGLWGDCLWRMLYPTVSGVEVLLGPGVDIGGWSSYPYQPGLMVQALYPFVTYLYVNGVLLNPGIWVVVLSDVDAPPCRVRVAVP